MSTVVRVATDGKESYWITLYRLAYSDDCVTFINLLDGAGNNEVIKILLSVQQNLNINGRVHKLFFARVYRYAW